MAHQSLIFPTYYLSALTSCWGKSLEGHVGQLTWELGLGNQGLYTPSLSLEYGFCLMSPLPEAAPRT